MTGRGRSIWAKYRTNRDIIEFQRSKYRSASKILRKHLLLRFRISHSGQDL